jgi:hypothetical protein
MIDSIMVILAVEEDATSGVPGTIYTSPSSIQFTACMKTTQKTCQLFRCILLMRVVCCDSGSMRHTGVDGFIIPPIPKC